MGNLEPGEKVHVIERRRFDGDARRHFVGEVESATDVSFRVNGFAFVGNSMTANFDRREPARTRIIPLGSSGVILNVIPRDVEVDEVRYELTSNNRLVVRAGSWQLGLDEFASR